MPFSRRKTVVGAVAAAGFVVGLAAGVALYMGGGENAIEVGAPAGLPRVLRTGDSLVVVEGVSLIGIEQDEVAAYLVADVTISEVLFTAPYASQGMLHDDYPSPPVIGKGRLRVYEPLGSVRDGAADAVGRLAGLADDQTRLVLLLGYWAPGLYPDWPAEWGVEWVGTTDSRGSIDFLSTADSDQAQVMARDLEAAGRGGDPFSTDVEKLEAWFAEIAIERGGGSKGPMQVAFELATRVDPYADWYAAEPTQRALDPESVPPEVFDGLLEVVVFVEVEESARLEGQYLAVLSDLGVLHIAYLSGGTHPATVFTDAVGDWRVVITDDLSQLGTSTAIAVIDASEFSPERGLSVLVTKETEGEWRVSSRSLGSSELSGVIADWLGRQSSTPSP
ncbi:MAG: hypothetical protein QY307_02340 [Acidimicrobiia bacterium]|nr:MAG: hypothetical protein QY307_02340 [Acidimicrobiia bacterium]